MPALKLQTINSNHEYDLSALSGIITKRSSRFKLDLSTYTLTGVLQAYMAHKRKVSSNYSNSSVTLKLKELETLIGEDIMPVDVCDDFYTEFYLYLCKVGLRPSTIDNYFNNIRAALTWGSKHNCTVSETYTDFNIKHYSRTKVALTADEVSLIAHFDIASSYQLKDSEFLERATKMLEADVERERQARLLEVERLIKHAKKNYQTSVQNIEKKYISRISRRHLSSVKRTTAEVLYIRDSVIAKETLDKELDRINKISIIPSEMEIDSLLQRRIQCLKHQAEPMRKLRIEILERVRDQFILQCSLGQRYSDISRITPSCFSDDLNTFTIIQKKTGNKAVVDIPKFAFDKKVVRDIIRKYKGYAPYPRDISNFNHKLKELVTLIGFKDVIKSENKINGEMIVEEVPKYSIITSHTARRTFATYNFNVRGYSEIAVRRATGHTDGRSFERYIIFDED